MPRNWASFPPHRLPVIALRVSDTIVRALADTGASQSLIDPRLIKQLDIEATDTGCGYRDESPPGAVRGS